MKNSLTDELIAWAAKKGPKVTERQLLEGIGELSSLNEEVKQKRLLSSLLKKVDLHKEIEHAYRLDQSIVSVEKEDPVGELTVNHLDLLTGLEFEKFLGWFFTLKGAKAHVTKSSGDHGIDIIVDMDNKKIAVQAKRYRTTSGVGAAAVRDSYAGMKNYDCQAALTIATTFFTRQAKEEAEKLGVELWDRSYLQNELNILNIKIEPSNAIKLTKPEAKIENRVLKHVMLHNALSLKNNQVLRINTDNGVVTLQNYQNELVGSINGSDAQWVNRYNQKGATFKVKFHSSRKEGMRVEAEAQWFEVE